MHKQRTTHRFLMLAVAAMLLSSLLAACGDAAPTVTTVAPPAAATSTTAAAPAAATPTTAAAPAAATATEPAAAATSTTAAAPATATTGTAAVPANITPNPALAGKLTIWGWEAALKALQVSDADFKAAYPNIQLDYVTRKPADTYQQIQLAAAAGAGLPDVSVIEDSHLSQFVNLGILADLTDRVQSYIPQFNPYRWQQATANGKYYAMPWDSGPVAVFYRRDVFQKAGVDPASIKTWDDYYAAAKTIKEKAGVPMWQQAKARNDARLFEMLLWQQGLGYIDKDGNVILDKDPKIAATLDYMGKFWKEDLAADTEPWTDPWYKQMADGTVATVPGAVWMGTFLKSFIAPDAAGKWGVFMLPAWTAGGVQSSNDGGSSLGIFEESKQKDLAWAYVQFYLGRPDEQVKIYAQTDLFPGLQSTYSEPAFSEADPYFNGQKARSFFVDVAKQIPTAGVYSPDYQEMNGLLQPELQKFALGQQTAQQALAAAASAIRDKTNRK
ncbi:MAG TPA: sugar ABC transporter substrate-binding protein [Chloroflexia bacterium]|nr:sugar ABC transporter substrate-binding protein [Chloroflexia bacterium]